MSILLPAPQRHAVGLNRLGLIKSTSNGRCSWAVSQLSEARRCEAISVSMLENDCLCARPPGLTGGIKICSGVEGDKAAAGGTMIDIGLPLGSTTAWPLAIEGECLVGDRPPRDGNSEGEGCREGSATWLSPCR